MFSAKVHVCKRETRRVPERKMERREKKRISFKRRITAMINESTPNTDRKNEIERKGK